VSPPILFLIAAFILVAIAGGIAGVRQLDQATIAQVRLEAVRDSLGDLFRTQLNAENAMRGYVATGEQIFLETPETQASGTFDGQADRIATELLALGLPHAAQQVDDLRAQHDHWRTAVEGPLLENRTRPDALLRQTDGKLITDQMRADDNVLRAEISAANEDVQSTLRRRINATVALSVGAIALFAIVSLWFALGRAQAVQALEREQSLVTVLQQALRVDGVALPRTQLGFAYTSATREALVGGDLIDAWRSRGDAGWFLIADVSGKGIAAARHSAFAQYAIRTLAAESDDPADVVARFNRLFLETFSEPGTFVVLFVAALDGRTGVMRYCSAGHGGAYVRRASGVEMLPPTGAVVGLDRDQAYETGTLALAPGELVVLATDGLTESRDEHGAFLGDDGVIAIIGATPPEPQLLCDRLVAAVTERAQGTIGDDLAILALRLLAVDSQRQPLTFTALGSTN
jgi:serine phosphatase RsbU (regulator of sigma subunit)